MRRRREESGSVLVLALLLTLIILGVGLTVMWVASSGAKVSANITRRQEALYAAEAGIERGRTILYQTNDWNALLKGGCGATLDDANVKGMILCDAGAPIENIAMLAGASVTPTKTQNLDKLKYTVWIRNDWIDECDVNTTHLSKVDCDGNGTVSGKDATDAQTDNNRRVILRSEGYGRDGLSYVALEAYVGGAARSTTNAVSSQKGVGAAGGNATIGNLGSN